MYIVNLCSTMFQANSMGKYMFFKSSWWKHYIVVCTKKPFTLSSWDIKQLMPNGSKTYNNSKTTKRTEENMRKYSGTLDLKSYLWYRTHQKYELLRKKRDQLDWSKLNFFTIQRHSYESEKANHSLGKIVTKHIPDKSLY